MPSSSQLAILVEVECLDKSQDHATLGVVVTDTGIGIGPKSLERIFCEFEQADASTTRKYGGTGLGLAVCARLVQMMGGTIDVESEVGTGSKFRFTISLPLDVEPEGASQRPRPEVEGVRVLVVDDNLTNCRILNEMLSSWGILTSTASNGQSALKMLSDAHQEQNGFDLVISDLNMPEMDGFHLAESIVQRSLLEPKSIIILTSGARPWQSSSLSNLGVEAQLLKPVKQSEIYDAIVSSLSSGTRTSSSPSLLGNGQGEVGAEVMRPLRVLLAEDNQVNQKLAIGILDKLGHSVTLASTGIEALRKLSSSEFDVVLMDVQMPDGWLGSCKVRRREQVTVNMSSDCHDCPRDEGDRKLSGGRYGRLFEQANSVAGYCGKAEIFRASTGRENGSRNFHWVPSGDSRASTAGRPFVGNSGSDCRSDFLG